MTEDCPIPRRELYARVHISAELIARAVALDRQLNLRMLAGGLTLQQRRRTWRRLQGRRWVEFVKRETAALIKDIYEASVHADLNRPSILARFVGIE